ncbi:NlpC/P60 family protein [Deinococcus sp. HMF7604]|uniref:C40 family peptidase n=1 Tax=Deinococcus betulae TaxID=2873312 RepID=UPI001CCC56A3|nr:C40 family peptidase [Deinococcus betulae]MBZ9751337.1 NlpC/P60 family protein [Deinococcus betulae]
MSLPSCPLPALRAALLAGLLLGAGAQAQGTGSADLRGQASVTVQAGDTAYGLARRAGLTLDALLTLNNLSSSALKVGQVLRLRPPEAPALTPPPLLSAQALPTQISAAPALASQAHLVQPGDTLYALARRYGVTVDSLLAANALPVGATLKAGQVLKLPLASASPAPAAGPGVSGIGGSPFLPGAPVPAAPTVQPGAPMPRAGLPGEPGHDVVAAPALVDPPALSSPFPLPEWRRAALALLDTPYAYGGTTRTGTDCSGFVLQVFTPLGFALPRTSAEQARVGTAVASSDLQPGDLVFFDTEGGGRVSHVGIYLGDDQFVSANSYQGRVTVDSLLTDRYWAPRFLQGRRILDAPLASARP